MNQLDRATQDNAASSEEVAASSEEMSSQAQLLNTMVVELRGLVYGKGQNQLAETSDGKTQSESGKSKPKAALVTAKSNSRKATQEPKKAVKPDSKPMLTVVENHEKPAAHASHETAPAKKASPVKQKELDLESVLPLGGGDRSVGKIEGF
jgi:hypothetical protein